MWGDLIGIALGVPTAVALVWLVCRLFARTIERPFIYGDCPFLHDEMRAAHKRRGEGPSTADGPTLTGHVRTHDRSSL